MLRNAVFLVLIIPTTHLKQKCADSLAEVDNILQKVVRDYSIVPNLMVITRLP
jgi:hypothetical protein